jgi:prefoldin subunit 5
MFKTLGGVMMLMQRNCSRLLIVLVALAILMIGCAKKTAIQNAYGTLNTAAEVYDVTMNIIAELYEDGKITNDQKATVVKYGEEFWRAYHTAVDTLDAYYNSDKTETDLNSALVALSNALESFLKYSKQLQEGRM